MYLHSNTERDDDKEKYTSEWLLGCILRRIKHQEKERSEDELARSMQKLINPGGKVKKEKKRRLG